MATRDFTLQLDGVVTLNRFRTALDAWGDAVSIAMNEIGPEHIFSQSVHDLTSGSAIVNLLIEFDIERSANAFVEHHDLFAATASDPGQVSNLTNIYQKPALQMRKAAGMDGGAGIVMASDRNDFVVLPTPVDLSAYKTMKEQSAGHSLEAYGVVTGKLQSLSSRNGLKACVYDSLFDTAVRFNLTPEQHETVRDLWDLEVVVHGIIRRHPQNGRPLSIRQVAHIQKSTGATPGGGWRRAQGVLRHVRPDLSAEGLIRLARNG